jgi:hypothetical protein
MGSTHMPRCATCSSGYPRSGQRNRRIPASSLAAHQDGLSCAQRQVGLAGRLRCCGSGSRTTCRRAPMAAGTHSRCRTRSRHRPCTANMAPTDGEAVTDPRRPAPRASAPQIASEERLQRKIQRGRLHGPLSTPLRPIPTAKLA